jgi:NitT/TauT family transport system permease protein
MGKTLLRSMVVVGLVVFIWELSCRILSLPAWLLPAPSSVVAALQKDFLALAQSFFFTLKLTIGAFLLAIVTGFLIGLLAHLSRFFKESFFPFTILLQTTPVVSVAPLLIIWFRNNAFLALLTCAWLVCVYPMISSTYAGLGKADANLQRLFTLYQSSVWHRVWHLDLPSALPFIMNGVRMTGGLALVGAVGAEFVAGTGGQELGLAYRLLMAAYNQETARLFAALSVVSAFGIFIHYSLSVAEDFLLRKLRVNGSFVLNNMK